VGRDTGRDTWVPWVPCVPVLTSDREPSVLIETSLWLLQPPWLQSKTKLKTKANKRSRMRTALCGHKTTGQLSPEPEDKLSHAESDYG
jgi:hypothetical protein